jgi:hypothetical protein
MDTRGVILLLLLTQTLGNQVSRIVVTESICARLFATIDSDFSTLISIVRDPTNPIFNATIQRMYDCCLDPAFKYNLNGHTLTGFDQIYTGILQQIAIYKFRWTVPPVPHVDPNVFEVYADNVVAKLNSDILHHYINATDLGLYVQAGKHFYYCAGDLHTGELRILNATLTNLVAVKGACPVC